MEIHKRVGRQISCENQQSLLRLYCTPCELIVCLLVYRLSVCDVAVMRGHGVELEPVVDPCTLGLPIPDA